jgi:DNA processing protein
VSGLSAQERHDRLRLARTDQVGPVTFQALVARFGSAGRALEQLGELSRRGGRATPLKAAPKAEIDAELRAGESLGARLLVIGDTDYPPLLAQIDPPPPVLWAHGNVSLLSRPGVGIVGARIASAGGQRFARSLAVDLGARDFVVVSGLARGIDGAAHEGALETGTVAVLAGGVDDIYPPEHLALYKSIVRMGCVVSENVMGRKAQARDFPRRNRIIAGLSLGVVVVEAELKSGSLITARLAAEQGRDVFAVPGSPLDPRARGVNDLIRQGAILCEGVDDVVAHLSAAPRTAEPERTLFGEQRLDEETLNQAAELLRGRVAALLSPVPIPRDEIVRLLRAPAPAVLAALVELSLAGAAELLPGGMVSGGPASD